MLETATRLPVEPADFKETTTYTVWAFAYWFMSR